MSAGTEHRILVVVDHTDAAPRASAGELLTAARGLGAVEAVWFGDGADAAAPRLALHGAELVHAIPLATAEAALPVSIAAALADLLQERGADTVLLSSTFENKEVAARLALAVDAGLVVDAAGIERGADGQVVTTQQAFAATWTLRGEVTAPRAVVALKANAVRAEPVGEPVEAEVRTHEPLGAADSRVRVVERTERPSSDRPDVGEAQVVVVGGRGTQGDFSAVEELADALGAAVGATRDATDEGWIDHSAMVGQTGATIAPLLYVGAGVSGAVHHRGGMQASGTVVAVNADPEAPIFEIADFGVVGDLFTVLPQAAAEIRRLRAEG